MWKGKRKSSRDGNEIEGREGCGRSGVPNPKGFDAFATRKHKAGIARIQFPVGTQPLCATKKNHT